MHISAHNFINQWVQLKGGWNWTDWTVIELSFEHDIALAGYEVIVIVLGIGYRVRWQYKPLFETDKGSVLKGRIDEIKENDHEQE